MKGADLGLLNRIDLFADLPSESLHILQGCVARRAYKKGAIIVEHSAAADAVYAVLSGRLKVVLPSADGSDVTVGLLGAGDVFGELGVLCRTERSARIVVLEAADVLRIEERAFLQLVEDSHVLSRKLNRLLAERVRGAGIRLETVTSAPVAQRVARAVCDLVERFAATTPPKVTLQMSVSQQEIAEIAISSRQSVNEYLQQWRRDGIVEHRRGAIIVHDLKRLRALADG